MGVLYRLFLSTPFFLPLSLSLSQQSLYDMRLWAGHPAYLQVATLAVQYASQSQTQVGLAAGAAQRGVKSKNILLKTRN